MRLPNPHGHTCQLCGLPASGLWSPAHNGSASLAVCCDCAVKALPALIADAANSDPYLIIAEVTAAFWHAQYWLQRGQVERLHKETAQEVMRQFHVHTRKHPYQN